MQTPKCAITKMLPVKKKELTPPECRRVVVNDTAATTLHCGNAHSSDMNKKSD